MKALIVTMPDKSKWQIPAELIAKVRAEYYVNGDIARGSTAPEQREAAIAEEIDIALNSKVELVDWAQNNMNWEDVSKSAVRLPTPAKEADYNKWWTNADIEVIDVPQV